jgi:hypothetical protein
MEDCSCVNTANLDGYITCVDCFKILPDMCIEEYSSAGTSRRNYIEDDIFKDFEIMIYLSKLPKTTVSQVKKEYTALVIHCSEYAENLLRGVNKKYMLYVILFYNLHLSGESVTFTHLNKQFNLKKKLFNKLRRPILIFFEHYRTVTITPSNYIKFIIMKLTQLNFIIDSNILKYYCTSIETHQSYNNDNPYTVCCGIAFLMLRGDKRFRKNSFTRHMNISDSIISKCIQNHLVIDLSLKH